MYQKLFLSSILGIILLLLSNCLLTSNPTTSYPITVTPSIPIKTIPASPSPIPKPSVPITTDLRFQGESIRPPGLLTLTFFIQPWSEALNTYITITLPSNINLVQGNLTWHGSLTVETPYTHTFIVNVHELTEVVEIEAGVTNYYARLSNGSLIQAGKGIFLYLRPTKDNLIEISRDPLFGVTPTPFIYETSPYFPETGVFTKEVDPDFFKNQSH